MSDLFAILYSDPNVADAAMKTLADLSRTGQIELTDACAVVKDGKGHVHLHQENNLSVIGSLVGLAIGTILGWFVLLPYLGIPGALIGALVGKVSDRGIEDRKMKDLSKEMQANSSALFFLLRGPEIDTVLKGLAVFDGRVFHTSLDKYKEEELEEKLELLRTQYLEEAEHPTAVRIKLPEVFVEKEEVVETIEKNRAETPGKKYRVVWYYTQWPQGSEHDVLARGLSQEEAEKIKEKSDPHLKGEYVLVEEENTGPEANPGP